MSCTRTSMSGKPTSGADVAPFGGPDGGRWPAAELDWEAKQERAAELAKQGCIDDAMPLWAEALSTARRTFARNDPRLAASIANHAFALRRKGDDDTARSLFHEALLIWDASAPWLDALKIERTARSSLFHLRMEARHWDTYEANARTRLRRFAEEGRTAIARLAEGAPGGSRGLDRWRAEKTATQRDARKLLAAALLVVRLEELGES